MQSCCPGTRPQTTEAVPICKMWVTTTLEQLRWKNCRPTADEANLSQSSICIFASHQLHLHESPLCLIADTFWLLAASTTRPQGKTAPHHTLCGCTRHSDIQRQGAAANKGACSNCVRHTEPSVSVRNSHSVIRIQIPTLCWSDAPLHKYEPPAYAGSRQFWLLRYASICHMFSQKECLSSAA